MNVEAPTRGLAGFLKSLNCDRAYGLALLAACALLLLPEWGGEAARVALRYERIALAAGEWWRLLSAHVVHLDLEHAVLNALGLVLMWALFAREDRKSTRLNSSHSQISYAVFCLKKKTKKKCEK